MNLMTTAQAARILRVAPRTVCKWCDCGRLPHSRESGTNNRLIREDDLRTFMKAHEFPQCESSTTND